MIDFRASSDCKTVITWQGEHCSVVVDVGTVDKASAVQLNALLLKLDMPDIHAYFNEYQFAIVRWYKELYGTREGVRRDWILNDVCGRVNVLKEDIAAYNHHCAIMETAEEAKAA